MTRGYMPKAKSIDWETPQDLFNTLNNEFSFTLDVAASEENTKCKRYFTKEDNGLKRSWSNERAWMNPPYGGHSLKVWTEKAKHEALNNNALVVGLLPNRTDTIWFHDNVFSCAEVRLIRGRLKFSDKGSATFGNVIIIWSCDIEPKIITCDRLGRIIELRKG